jgi:hypothetical protein
MDILLIIITRQSLSVRKTMDTGDSLEGRVGRWEKEPPPTPSKKKEESRGRFPPNTGA